MKCGKTNLCEVNTVVKGKYVVTWNKHITGLDVYSEKVFILLDMIVRDMKGWEVGIMLTNGYVMWLSRELIMTLNIDTIVDYVFRIGIVKDHREIAGVIFDNTNDVDTFVDRLEKKYIIHVLKQ